MRIIYTVALIEGFSTLAIQIIALRMAAPITGSSSIVTSVIIGIILLALSIGYWRGGVIASRLDAQAIRYTLMRYLVIAGVYYAVITFGLQGLLLNWLLQHVSYVLTLFITAMLVLFLPVYIASQTIPLLTELIDEPSKGKAAGKMLFASTVGSFFGSVLTSIVLFQWWGVALTGIVVTSVLVASAGLLIWPISRARAYGIFCCATLLGLGLARYRGSLPLEVLYHMDSAYQQIDIVQYGDTTPVRVFLTNNAYASAFSVADQQSPFPYIREAVSLTTQLQPQEVLVIGTAGFTYPYELATTIDQIERIDAVDIDPRVKRIAEDYFLQTSLPDHVIFYPQSARYVVNQAIEDHRSYDLIFVDAFHGKSLPDELTTLEFFAGLQQLLSNDGVLMINFILDRSLKSDLAQSLFATLEEVFGAVWVKQTTQNDTHLIENFIVTTEKLHNDYVAPPVSSTAQVYTDDKRSTEIDTMKMYWR